MRRVKVHSVEYELPPSTEARRVSVQGAADEKAASLAVEKHHEGLTVVIKGVEYLTDLKQLRG
jgi:hypothetical protein